MAALIDPTTKTVTQWQPQGPFLPSLRATLACTQLDSIMVARGLCLWIDNFGLLQPRSALFRFPDSTLRFAGKAVLTGVDPDGMPCDFAPGFDIATLSSSLNWCPGESVKAIREELQVVATELGPWPRVMRIPEFDQPLRNGATAPFDAAPVHLPPEAVQPPTGPRIAPEPAIADLPPQTMMEGSSVEKLPTVVWRVVSDDEADMFVATQYAFGAGGEPTGREAVFKDLAEVAAYLAKQGAERLPDDPDAPDDVVAQFVA